MSSDYSAVKDALTKGADPVMLCTTCPWDRTCVTPPTMTSAEIDAKMAEATTQDKASLKTARGAGDDPGLPVRMLITAVAYGGKDTSAQVCPVFALRLRSGNGREIADAVKASMQNWDDGA